MQETDFEWESRLRELASRLLFTLTKDGAQFSLYRETDVPLIQGDRCTASRSAR